MEPFTCRVQQHALGSCSTQSDTRLLQAALLPSPSLGVGCLTVRPGAVTATQMALWAAQQAVTPGQGSSVHTSSLDSSRRSSAGEAPRKPCSLHLQAHELLFNAQPTSSINACMHPGASASRWSDALQALQRRSGPYLQPSGVLQMASQQALCS